jgi:UDP-glucose 4-epimerase
LSIENPKLTHDVNVNGTSNVLGLSEKAGVKKFVFSSSCAVYGEPVYLPIDEKHPANPISPYAESKLASERECLRLNMENRLKSVILRFFNVYGPKQGLNDYSGVITKFKDRIEQRLPLLIYGDGLQTRDFVYIRDIVNAIILALENQAANGEIFNIGTGRATSIKELSRTMLSLAGVDLNVINDPDRLGEIVHSYADVSKANRLLKYKPKFTLTDGLKELLHEDTLLPP